MRHGAAGSIEAPALLLVRNCRRTIAMTLIVVTALLISAPLASQERGQPDPSISPGDVVRIQLRALQSNDRPSPDAGIRTVWTFAHPANKRQTGPLSRFAAMIKGPGCRSLINHRHHQIKMLAKTDNRADFAVQVTAADGKVYFYIWQVAPVNQAGAMGVWMTIGVSPPHLTGEET